MRRNEPCQVSFVHKVSLDLPLGRYCRQVERIEIPSRPVADHVVSGVLQAVHLVAGPVSLAIHDVGQPVLQADPLSQLGTALRGLHFAS